MGQVIYNLLCGISLFVFNIHHVKNKQKSHVIIIYKNKTYIYIYINNFIKICTYLKTCVVFHGRCKDNKQVFNIYVYI